MLPVHFRAIADTYESSPLLQNGARTSGALWSVVTVRLVGIRVLHEHEVLAPFYDLLGRLVRLDDAPPYQRVIIGICTTPARGIFESATPTQVCKHTYEIDHH